MTDDDREMLFGMAEELAGYVVLDYERKIFRTVRRSNSSPVLRP